MTLMTLVLNLEINSIDLKMLEIFYYLRRKVGNCTFRESQAKELISQLLVILVILFIYFFKVYDQMGHTASSFLF